MFDSLSTSLQKVFKHLRGYGKLTESNLQEALREVRLALLEADVHYQVARDFIAAVKEKALGRDVLDSITPGQQFVKHVHDELVALLGGSRRDFDLSAHPSIVMLLGLHGAGKTTTAAKLGRRWRKDGKSVLLAACDIRRPAAVDQLRILAGQVECGFIAPRGGESVPAFGARAVEEGTRQGSQVIVLDTGGRFQIDEDLVGELKALQTHVRAGNVVLVLDAAIGQESVHVAETFHREVGLTGLILTKLDGDARGGAALSVRKVTGCPVLLVGTGERTENLEPFHPERIAARILGMGDVVSLVEKTQAAVDVQEMARMEERLQRNTLDLEDFLAQLRQLKKLGPLENLLEMLPGAANVSAFDRDQVARMSGQETKRAEAIILSMTPAERRRPELINASRRRRIARGSGTDVAAVNDLLKRFDQARKMARQLKQVQKRFRRTGMP